MAVTPCCRTTFSLALPLAVCLVVAPYRYVSMRLFAFALAPESLYEEMSVNESLLGAVPALRVGQTASSFDPDGQVMSLAVPACKSCACA